MVERVVTKEREEKLFNLSLTTLQPISHATHPHFSTFTPLLQFFLHQVSISLGSSSPHWLIKTTRLCFSQRKLDLRWIELGFLEVPWISGLVWTLAIILPCLCCFEVPLCSQTSSLSCCSVGWKVLMIFKEIELGCHLFLVGCWSSNFLH